MITVQATVVVGRVTGEAMEEVMEVSNFLGMSFFLFTEVFHSNIPFSVHLNTGGGGYGGGFGGKQEHWYFPGFFLYILIMFFIFLISPSCHFIRHRCWLWRRRGWKFRWGRQWTRFDSSSDRLPQARTRYFRKGFLHRTPRCNQAARS